MISMTKIRLGALRCPVAAHLGSGAEVAFGPAFGAAFGGGAGVSWAAQRHQSALVSKRPVDLIPPVAAYNTTSVSAPPERSP